MSAPEPPDPPVPPDLMGALNTSFVDGDSDWLHPHMLLLLVLYVVVLFLGLMGNTSLILALCSQQGRLKNPLLLSLCLADLLVCGCSVPITVAVVMTSRRSWAMAESACKGVFYMQVLPVAASTLSLMALSLDRYATVKRPRMFSTLSPRSYMPALASVLVWVVAAVTSTPVLLVRMADLTEGDPCHEQWASADLRLGFIVTHLVIVFIVPSFTVVISHFGVRAKLCALSLTARAAHGELPLPMPILRRPTHVIIVAGMANAEQAKKVLYQNNGGTEDESSEEVVKEKKLLDSKGRPYPRQPSYRTNGAPRCARPNKALRESRRQAGQGAESLLAPQPQASTLHSRRRLANVLVSVATVFAGCWLPHVACTLYAELTLDSGYRTLQDFSLLLGHAHSALNPMVYWALNYQSLRQQSCAPCGRISSAHRFLRGHLRFPHAPPPPSSTNEAALGPFNPRYIKARPMTPRPAGSSHYLY